MIRTHPQNDDSSTTIPVLVRYGLIAFAVYVLAQTLLMLLMYGTSAKLLNDLVEFYTLFPVGALEHFYSPPPLFSAPPAWAVMIVLAYLISTVVVVTVARR